MASSGLRFSHEHPMESTEHEHSRRPSIAASIASVVSAPPKARRFMARLGLGNTARRTLGIGLLLVTVVLWTLSNFLASDIFSDKTFNKPFFVLYANSTVFVVSLIPMFAKYVAKNGAAGIRRDVARMWHEHRQRGQYNKAATEDDEEEATSEELIVDDNNVAAEENSGAEQLDFRETFLLSLEFCMLWFGANYFASACLEYTSVASATILNSTSSIWTLILCAIFGVERFTLRKLGGVTSSLVGIVLISTIDLSGNNDENRGSFPHKSAGQIAKGDLLALLSAVLYGVYVTVMKRRVSNEERVNMRLFFGLVGCLTMFCLWPLFFIFHWTNIEPFEMPPNGKVWAVIIGNSLASFVSDISWAYAMLLTTPLVVTVGISLTIPLSLIGEMIQYGQYSSFMYWIGAAVMFVSFAFINHESHEDSEAKEEDRPAQRAAVIIEERD